MRFWKPSVAVKQVVLDKHSRFAELRLGDCSGVGDVFNSFNLADSQLKLRDVQKMHQVMSSRITSCVGADQNESSMSTLSENSEAPVSSEEADHRILSVGGDQATPGEEDGSCGSAVWRLVDWLFFSREKIYLHW